MREVELCSLSEIREVKKRLFKVEEIPILLIYEKEKVYALNNKCPHAGGKLNEGRIEEGTLTCLNHGACFDLESGELRLDMLDEDLRETIDEDNLPFGPMTTYEVVINGERVSILIPR